MCGLTSKKEKAHCPPFPSLRTKTVPSAQNYAFTICFFILGRYFAYRGPPRAAKVYLSVLNEEGLDSP